MILFINICNCGQSFAQTEISKEVYPVSVTEAKRQNIVLSLETMGTVQPRQRAFISSEIDGIIKNILVNEGQIVSKDQLIATVDSSLLEVNLSRERASLEIAQIINNRHKIDLIISKIKLDQAKYQFKKFTDLYKSYQELFEVGGITKEKLNQNEVELNRLRTEYKLANEKLNSLNQKSDSGITEPQASLDRVKANINEIQLKIDKCKIKSPISGIVAQKAKWVGEKVSFSDSHIATIIDINSVFIEVEISESNNFKINLGQKAVARFDAYPGVKYGGVVHFINPVVNSESRTFKIHILANNPGLKLKPGMFSRSEIILKETSNSIAIPPECIIIDNNKKFVFVIKENIAFKREIITGLYTDNEVEILSGLELNEKVVILGQKNLKNLSSVIITENIDML
jgi:multidrug efflux pump subunit AcrA (membrane-fusion protein)